MERKGQGTWVRRLLLAMGMFIASGLWGTCPVPVLPVVEDIYSQLARVPMPNIRYARGVYLITRSEMAGSGVVPASFLRGIGWTYSTPPDRLGQGRLVVYLQNTEDTVLSKSPTWTEAIAGMTRVHDATTTIPNVPGPVDIPFSIASAFTYTSGGLYVAFDWETQGSLDTAPVTTPLSVAGGMMREQSNDAPPATLDGVGVLSDRPATRLLVGLDSPDAGVAALYSMGSLPTQVGVVQTLQAHITNNGSATLTNLPVNLTISGANTFTDTKYISSLAPCTSTTVTFSPFNPVTPGMYQVQVSVPEGDGEAANNSLSHSLEVTPNRASFKYPGTPITQGIGASNATAELLARFNLGEASQVDAVILEFAKALTPAATYRVSVRQDNGSGAPGSILYQDSEDRFVEAAGAVTIRLPSAVPVGPGFFFVGARQTGDSNMTLSCDNERPLRPGAFFISRNGGAFSDLSLAPNLPYKMNIGAILGACLAPLSVQVQPDGTGTACPGDPIPFTAQTTGGTPPFSYQWTEDGADIPGANGPTYSATKATSGTFAYNCKVSDVGGCLDIQDPAPPSGSWGVPTVINPSVSTGTVNTPFSQTFLHQGGSSPVTYSTASTLPAGLSLSSTGTLSGTPMERGTFPITVTVASNAACGSTGSVYVLVISCPSISISPASLPDGTPGVPYGPVVFSQSGGLGTVSWSSSGTLPSGMSFNDSTGTLSGIPAAAGHFSITVTSTDAIGCTGTRDYSFRICPVLGLSPATLPEGTLGVAYSQILTASGGPGPFTFQVTGGTPPAWLTLTPEGTLAGTPSVVGTSVFTVTATDPNGCTASRQYTLGVRRLSSVALASSANPVAEDLSFTLTATVTGVAPTGTVQFYDGGTPLGGPAPLDAGQATLTAGPMSPGNHLITARYSGDASHFESTSGPLKQVVLSLPTLFDTSFKDALGTHRLCLDTRTGNWRWETRGRLGAVVYRGTSRLSGWQVLTVTPAGEGYQLRGSLDRVTHKASFTLLKVAANGIPTLMASLVDRNPDGNPPCGTP
ncbi:MAG: Ig-like domain repeat protein [Acidobacteria bacterium]|nr:Ig-like domain repeat protein [Acidobacteriota bacterium]